MAEEIKKPEVKKETKADAQIRRANEAAERQEKANAELKSLIERQETLAVEKTLGGQADAATAPPKPETEDEKWAKDAKERYKGTGMDPTPDV